MSGLGLDRFTASWNILVLGSLMLYLKAVRRRTRKNFLASAIECRGQLLVFRAKGLAKGLGLFGFSLLAGFRDP